MSRGDASTKEFDNVRNEGYFKSHDLISTAREDYGLFNHVLALYKGGDFQQRG
jgi:hypothetical protein